MRRNLTACHVALHAESDVTNVITSGVTENLELWTCYVMVFLFGVVAIAVAMGFNAVRKKVFLDKVNFLIAFNDDNHQ